MTQRRLCHKCGDEILSNYFDALLQDVGHRGSSFTDVDALTHDGATDRYLFQEFKQDGEVIAPGQRTALNGLARKDFLTVWAVRRLHNGSIEWLDLARSKGVETITEREYQRRFKCWWDNKDWTAQPSSTITAADINWG